MPTKLFVMFKLKPSSMSAMRKRFLPLKRQLFPMLIELPDMQLDKQ
jgi:hypothetical protein